MGLSRVRRNSHDGWQVRGRLSFEFEISWILNKTWNVLLCRETAPIRALRFAVGMDSRHTPESCCGGNAAWPSPLISNYTASRSFSRPCRALLQTTWIGFVASET